jgi:putative flippase GtrA
VQSVFLRYVAVGALVGLLASLAIWGANEVIGDSTWLYAIFILFIYALGILFSYLLHRKYTFSKASNTPSNKNILQFTFVALASGLAVTALATCLRTLAPWPNEIAQHSGWISFCIANLCVAVISFHVNRVWVFK